MKKPALISFFILACLVSFSQPTFLKRLSFNVENSTSYVHPEDSVLQLLAFSSSINGSHFILTGTKREVVTIYKISDNGSILWEISGGGLATSSKWWVQGLHGTPDGGCVLALMSESWLVSNAKYASILKYDSLGNQQWSIQLPNNFPFSGLIEQETYDIAILPTGYACLSMDSVFLLNSTGNLIGSLNYFGSGRILGTSNGDIFISTNNFTGKIDGNGNPIYQINGTLLNQDTLIYTLLGDSLHQLDNTNGSYLSSQYLHLGGAKLLLLSDGGWIKYNFTTIMRYNQNGNLLWTENVTLPRFGMNLIGELSNGSLLSGGTFRSMDRSHATDVDYSSFIFSIDSLGKSIIDSTTNSWPGDANDDNILEFGDAIYIALAQGSTGPQRFDSTIYYNECSYSSGDIATDFANSFAIGINHKQCDVCSDGIIDTLDLVEGATGGLLYRGLPTNWRFSSHSNEQSNNNSTIPYFSCIPDRDSASAGDTIRYYFILGDNGVLIDSIFGLAFHLRFDTSNSPWPPHIGVNLGAHAIDSDLGSLPNMLSLSREVSGQEIGLVTGRRDLHNAYLVQDTIGFAEILIEDSTSGNIDLDMSLISFKAITAVGFPIDFQFHSIPVHIHNSSTSVNELNDDQYRIYPVPSTNTLIIDQLRNENLELRIFNTTGKLLYSEFAQNVKRVTVNISDFPSGIYFISILKKDSSIYSKFIIKE